MLEGDTSDNIPGINKVGPKTVAKWFGELDGDMDKIRELVQQQYQKQYGEDWRSAYEEVASLLWMRRVKDKECPFLY
jgi:5'-3' exonuclease